MANPRRLVVIGGVAAGMSAASKARRSDPALAISVFEQGGWVSYSACGLPYFVGGLVGSADALVARTPQEFARQGIEVHLHRRVAAIDPARRVVRVEPLDAPDAPALEQPYDALVIAAGARPNRPPVAGLDLEGVFALTTMPDALGLREFIQRHRPRRAVIVGGGYIGLEAAENLSRHSIAVTVVQRPEQLLTGLAPEFSDMVAAELSRQGVDMSLCDSVLEACAGRDGRVACVETSQGSIETDLVLLATGVRPNVEVASAAGVALGETGAIAVGPQLQTNLDGVYAAGDCAEHFHRVTRRPAWVPLGTVANKQGRIAGANAAGGDETFPGIVGTTITRVFDLGVGRTGLSPEEARRAGLDFAAASVDYTDIAGYYPGAAPLRLLIVAERGSGRLLGLQAIGKGADKRVDVAAAALFAGMTVDQIAWLDLGYAPPFNSVWDPLLVAASAVQRQL
jgi:NADPH-dependent 2,4-dienoyl-CoA reductase/sulfur reductase-like enzyme